MNIKKLVLLFGLFFASAVIFIFPAAAEASHVNCGDTITTSTTLDSNLNCTGNGLTIGADGITLDCNGFTISGVVAGDGIAIPGKQNIAVKNCNISGFLAGIHLNFSTNNVLTNNTVNTVGGYGVAIYLVSSFNNTLTNNTVQGIFLDNSASNTVSNNNVSFNGSGAGIDLSTSSGNTVTNNIIDSNYIGIYIHSVLGISWGNIITNNTITNSSTDGIQMYIGQYNIVANNTIKNANNYGITMRNVSWWNNLTSNTVCSGGLDILQDISWGSTGDLNTCNVTTNWNDTGTTGCTYYCGQVLNPIPVLFVHGIYSDDTVWSQVENSVANAGYQVFKVGQVLGKKGLVPNNGDIKQLAGDVKSAIQIVKQQAGVNKVDVIAHSMGGLATRWYIANAGYQNDIDKLITLGTPNEGAPIARSLVSVVFGGLIGDSILDIAKAQMIPGSNFLNALNSNFSTQGVTHTEVAGTDTNNVALAATLTAINLLPFPYNIIFQLGFPYSYFFTVNDTIVPAASVNIPNISCYEHLNVHTDALDFLNSPAYYDDPAVISEIIAILNGSQTTFSQCVEANTQSGTNTQNLNVSDSVNPGEIKTIVNQGLGTEFKSSLMWQGGTLNQEFVSPTGVTVNASNYQSYGGVSYSTGSFSGSNYEFFEFNAPEQGTWTVKVIGINITAATTFNLNVAFTDSVNVDFYTDKTNYAPNETVILRTQLTDSSGPVLNAGVEVLIVDPNGADTTINLRDDGLSNDVLANDGIYGNVFSGTVLEGTYNAGITATTTQFQINDGDAFFVDLQPDLSIQSQDISFNPSVLSKTEDNNVSVSATIYNIGDEDVSGAEIDFYDGDPIKGGTIFATTSVSVLAGSSSQTQANLFIPKQKFGSAGAGKASGTLIKDHDIHVIISSYSGFIEKDYLNNQASKLLKYGR